MPALAPEGHSGFFSYIGGARFAILIFFLGGFLPQRGI